MQLQSLLHDLPVQASDDTDIKGISIDTRTLEPGELFVALRGHELDGHHFLSQAVDAGAGALLVEQSSMDQIPDVSSTPVLSTEDTRSLLPRLLKRFYGDPSEDLILIGVTGTNGKTTTTHLIESILSARGEEVGLFGTITWRFRDRELKGDCTTPSIVDNYRLLREWADRGATAVVMEVSSHGLEQGRVEGLEFTAGAFTNLSQDHLDYHGDMESYFEAKRKLFDQSQLKIAWAEGEYGSRLAREPNVISVAEQGDYRVEDPRVDIGGIRFTLHTPRGESISLQSPLTGLFNYKNIALAAALTRELDTEPEDIVEGVKQCQGVPGRCERLPGPPPVVVDYAHTPDAMRNVIESLSPLTDGELICVFGAGGDRDRTKRPRMGRIAVEQADYSVVTSDNPRSEDPEAIIDDILEGMDDKSKTHVQVDRGQAIREAVERAGEDDLVLIVGKGHETEQVIGDRVIPFADIEVARDILRSRNGNSSSRTVSDHE